MRPFASVVGLAPSGPGSAPVRFADAHKHGTAADIFLRPQLPPMSTPLRPAKFNYGRHEAPVQFRPNGSFWAANGLGPVVFSFLLILALIAAMAVPWTYQTQRVVHNGETCSWVEMRSWSRFYCRKTLAPAACDDVFRSGAGRFCSEALSTDADSHAASTRARLHLTTNTHANSLSNSNSNGNLGDDLMSASLLDTHNTHTSAASGGAVPSAQASTPIGGFTYFTRSRKGLTSHADALHARDSALNSASKGRHAPPGSNTGAEAAAAAAAPGISLSEMALSELSMTDSAAASVGGGETLLAQVLAADTDESGFDWRSAHRALNVDDAALRSLYTRSAVLMGCALVAAIGLLLGFVVRCVAPSKAARTSWHVAIALVGVVCLALALVTFAHGHPAAHRRAVETFPRVPGAPPSVTLSAPRAGELSPPVPAFPGGGSAQCGFGPCVSFSGSAPGGVPSPVPAGAVATLAWGPAGWSVALGCLALFAVLALWATRHGDTVSVSALQAHAHAAGGANNIVKQRQQQRQQQQQRQKAKQALAQAQAQGQGQGQKGGRVAASGAARTAVAAFNNNEISLSEGEVTSDVNSTSSSNYYNAANSRNSRAQSQSQTQYQQRLRNAVSGAGSHSHGHGGIVLSSVSVVGASGSGSGSASAEVRAAAAVGNAIR